jgi:hypothetical protein
MQSMFFKRFLRKGRPEPQGFVHLDFERTFPHVLWTSDCGVDHDYPDGFRYKVLTIWPGPRGNFEVVLLHETRSGAKTI